MKLLFFGTPEEAVPFLEQCARDHEVMAVVTRPDRPAGRGLEVQPPAVKVLAEKLQIRVFQPERPSEITGALRDLSADAAVVVAYGKLLKRDVLDSTRLGFLNVHFSLLPQYRGAAPIEWALMDGNKITGVTVFWLDEGMDTGPIQVASRTAIEDDDDAITLKRRLIQLGLETLSHALNEISHGRVHQTPQGQARTQSLAPKITRDHALVDFDRPAASLHHFVRGLAGGPRAYLKLPSGKSLAILKTRYESDAPETEKTPPGTVVVVDKTDGILIQCCPGRIWVVVVQPEGKRQIAAADFANGLRLKPGDRLA